MNERDFKADHFKTMEELLDTIDTWLDNEELYGTLYDDFTFTLKDGFYLDEDGEYLLASVNYNFKNLNDEVEIIEEEKEIEKKIKKIIISMDDDSMPYVTNNKYQKLSYSEIDLLFASKINELIDVLNSIKKEK